MATLRHIYALLQNTASLLGAILSAGLLVGSVQAAQEPTPSWGPWYVLGPFHHPLGSADVKPAHKPEKQLKQMKAGRDWDGLEDDYVGKAKHRVAWKRLGDPAKDQPQKIDLGLINLLQAVPPLAEVPNWSNQAVAYLYRQVVVETPTSIEVQFGSDDGLRFWLNGELLVSSSAARGVNPKSERLKLHLNPGPNHILVKINNGGGAWGFQMQAYAHVSQDEVNQAIEHGVKYLLSRQLIDGSWGNMQSSYRTGQTALSIYTLVKSGLPPRHPAILEALAYLEENPTTRTYSIGCQLMALQAINDPEHRPWMEELLGDLLSWQQRRGDWAYPNGAPDLSCTQFGALGLRSAADRGLEVPVEAWLKLADAVLDYQEKKSKVEIPASHGEKYGGKWSIAGFSYKPGKPNRPSGSMTAAGVATLKFCQVYLGDKMPSTLSTKINRQVDLGVNWLSQNWSVSSNPHRGGAYLHYYLYGLERVGAIMNTDFIGDHDWYWDGADFLLGSQNKEFGHWPDPWGRSESATCFSLLFLERATRAAFTDPRGKTAKRVVKSDPAAGKIHMSAMVGSPATFWLHGKDQAAMEQHTILEVEYYARKAVAEGQPVGDWRLLSVVEAPEDLRPRERFASRYMFESAGTWEMKAVALCDKDRSLSSAVVQLEIIEATAATVSSYPRDARKNLIPRNQPKITVSSGGNGRTLIDNSFATRWRCNAKDKAPEFTIELRRSVNADKLIFSHALTRPSEQKDHPRAKWLRVWIDKNDPFEVELDLNFRVKTVHKFAATQSVRKIRVEILEYEGGKVGSASVGFTEIELQGPRKRRGKR
jgi:hypothetical protein